MPGSEFIAAGIADGTIDTVVLAFPDMHGRPVGKRVTPDFYRTHVAEHGIEVCDYLLAVDVDMNPLPGYRFANWDMGYGDMVCHPDYSTARPLPWLPGTVMVIGDLTDEDGAPIEVSPRQILRRQIARAAERGFTVQSATELEFFLFRESYEEADEKHWKGLTPHASTIEDYQLLQTSREEYILRRIRQEMCAADIPVEFSKGEAGRGQHEVNVTFAEALQTADRHLVFKNGIKEIAAQEGRAATFMAKWTMNDVGSSCHVHNSLWDSASGEPVMGDPEHPTGLSRVGRQFLAGQLHAARQLAWCAAPTVNSYRRYIPGSWAPTAVVWGEDNRTCGFRVVGHGRGRRVESRVPGADVNPYLAVAACIAAGLYGIDH
jgi:glutamine synthetase